ncbi:MAG: type II toxin-antitoxin system VapC family toxin [Thaumarchaeota archaeon]|nr:type II toxin-antitoxin system VapC family toxin [Nitrososphaerota archaeon]
MNPTDAQEAAAIYAASRISPYDCVHAAVMKRNGLDEIVSADMEFDKVPWLKRIDPKLAGERT